jgi:hypothetical protein
MTPTTRATSSYDIAIIGAGAAGVCAAFAAGPSARTVLIESSQRFGGRVTAAMHRSICGLYASSPKDALDTLNDGGQRELVSRLLRKAPGQVTPKQMGKAWVLEFPAAAWEASLAEMCGESGADIRMGCRVGAVRREGNRILAIQLDDPGLNWIDVKVVVDCSGGGSVLELAGPDTYQPPQRISARMLGGFSARLSGIAGDSELLRLQVPFALAKGVETGQLPKIARFGVFYPGTANGEGICKLAISLKDFTNESASALMQQVVGYLAKEIPALVDAHIVEKSPSVQRRDGLRLAGRFVVSEKDVLEGRKHGDDAVHAWWPIEKWSEAEGPSYAYPPEGRWYDIPADALRCATLENLLAAGGCLSATASAMASARVSGICLATGWAAGKEAIADCQLPIAE